MTKHRKPRVPADQRPYEVGYCKPDPAAGFQKGQVANPKGRPRKKGLREQLDATLNQNITSRTGDRIVKIPVFQAIIQVQANKAMNGDTTAAAFIVRMCNQLPPSTKSNGDTGNLDSVDRQMLLEYAQRVIENAKKDES